MKAGDARPHVGIIVAIADDLTLDCKVPTMSDVVVEGIRPRVVGPLLWTPQVGRKVALVEGLGITPEESLRWIGAAYDDGDEAVVPTNLDPGDYRLRSQEGRVAVQLEDGDDDGTNTALRLGRRTASEPVVLGDLYQTWMELTLDEIDDLITQVDNALVAHDTLGAAHLVVLGLEATWVTAVSLGAGTVAEGVIYNTGITVFVAALTAWRATLSTIRTSLSTIQVNLSQQNTDIPDHLSDFTFAAKAPDTEAQ